MRQLTKKKRMPRRDSAACLGIVTPCKPRHTGAAHAAWASASTAVANAQLPEEAREGIRKFHGGLPGGARGATYSCIIDEHGWDVAPKTPAGRVLTVIKFFLIT